LDWIYDNCTASLPALCKRCTTTPCFPGGYVTHNCSLYKDLQCTPCTLCNATTQFITRDCGEFVDTVCQGWSVLVQVRVCVCAEAGGLGEVLV
jgi:hypothetical protein